MVAQKTTKTTRNLPGTKLEDWNYPDSDVDCHLMIQKLISKNHADIDTILEEPMQFHPSLWKYYQLKYILVLIYRQVCLQLDELFCMLLQECSTKSCPEMKASEWVYLCAAHTEPSSCSAIDYILHTLESASTLLNAGAVGPKE